MLVFYRRFFCRFCFSQEWLTLPVVDTAGEVMPVAIPEADTTGDIPVVRIVEAPITGEPTTEAITAAATTGTGGMAGMAAIIALTDGMATAPGVIMAGMAADRGGDTMAGTAIPGGDGVTPTTAIPTIPIRTLILTPIRTRRIRIINFPPRANHSRPIGTTVRTLKVITLTSAVARVDGSK